MSLDLRVVDVTNLKGKYSRFVRATFRGVSKDSNVLENSGRQAYFNKEFTWELSSPLVEDEALEIRVFNRNKVFQDRLIGAYRLRLNAVIAQGHVEGTESILSPSHKLLPTQVQFKLRYLAPSSANFYEDYIGRGDDSKSRKSNFTSHTINSNLPGSNIARDTTDLHDDKELYHPRIMPSTMVNATPTEFQVQVRIIEGRELAGMNIDPVVSITLGEQKKTTTVKSQTNNPVWDEYFCFELITTESQALDHILQFDVLTGRNIISQGRIIGNFKLDLWYIYKSPDHCIFDKWAPLVDGANTECKGFLRLDLCVFGKGDIQRDPPPRGKDDDDIERNLIFPENTLVCRPVHKYVFKIYRAEGLPRMNVKLMANVKKALTRKATELTDPFVEISFAGIKGKTSTKKNKYKPVFNEKITFTEFFPPLCKTITIQLKDSDALSDEPIGTHFLDIETISNKGDSNLGFMPVFGPSWVNLYGSTRDYAMFDEHVDLNNGIGEGISYRGRILMSIECFEAEPDETGTFLKEDTPPLPKSKEGKLESHLLFATFYEASMIPKKIGDKPVEFEVTIGEFGVYLEEEQQTSSKNGDDVDEEDLMADDSTVVASTMTKPCRPICRGTEKYYSVPFESRKLCTYVKFPYEDQRRRIYNQIMIQKIFKSLEENWGELDERVRLELKGTYMLLRRLMGDIVHMCSLFIELCDGKKTNTHLGKNQLDRERMRVCVIELKNVSVTAAKIADACSKVTSSTPNILQIIKDNVAKAHGLMKKVKAIVHEPQHTLPDIFVWMLSGGKRVAYTRVPATDVMYSKVDFERGIHAGRVQTIFLRLPGKKGHGEKGWKIQAKVEIRIWLGLMNKYPVGEYINDAPSGFEIDEPLSLIIPPKELYYQEKQKFTVRAHMYQARSLIGSDESGLSDAFARVIITNQAQETQVIDKTRSPTWDNMLKFENIEFWGDPEEFAVNPPVIVIEIFDMDKELIGSDSIEFIGRALARPVVKLANEPYEKPFFPPTLQWFEIFRGETKAGELLGAFEMFHILDDEESLEFLPPDPPLEDTESKPKMPVPADIRPVMTKHRVEVICWGVREMKRAQLLSINRPRVDIDCCYPITQLGSMESKAFVESSICKNARVNPNFDDPIILFDVELPENKKYIPPVTLRVHDIRAFGRKVLVGSHVIDSLHKYFMDNSSFVKRNELDGEVKPKVDEDQEDGPLGIAIPIAEEEKPPEEKKVEKKGKEQPDKDEEILDWWTRFYETLRDQEKENSKKPKKKKEKQKNAVTAKAPAKNDVPRLTVYHTELEEVECFNGFNDFMATFDLLRGKKTEDEDDLQRRFSGKVKGNIRVWKKPYPEGFNENDSKGTFYKLPSNDPIKLLVRVYVVRCLNLHPTDPNGKADPYLVVHLGKKTHKDRDNYVSKQLSPEFGRVFEFEPTLPFDNMLTVQVFDWDMMSGDDLIGQTEIDIENRFYSKHRASCGLQKDYITHGYAKWRDPQKPSQILTKICKDEGLEGPSFNSGTCSIEGIDFEGPAEVCDAKGRGKPSDEPCALVALQRFHEIPKKGYHICPEYVESRSLYSPEKPGLEQGRVMLWVDMFPMDLSLPGPPIDISPRKPTEYELRLIIWNTDSVRLEETNIVTGEASSDIYVKGWLEGNREFRQETDVHYRSTDGSGMFNWRFIFQFMFHKSEEKIVTKKKASIFSVDLTEQKHPPNLYLQVWDADLISADDILGDLIMPLSHIPNPAKTAKNCSLKMLQDDYLTGSIIKAKHMKGWWPFQYNPDDDDDPKPKLAGKVEAEFELLTKEEAEAAPAGKGREEPQPLAKPNRPSDAFGLFMSPLKMIGFLCNSFKWLLIKLIIVGLILLLIGLFFYSMPGYTVKKLFGV